MGRIALTERTYNFFIKYTKYNLVTITGCIKSRQPRNAINYTSYTDANIKIPSYLKCTHKCPQQNTLIELFFFIKIIKENASEPPAYICNIFTQNIKSNIIFYLNLLIYFIYKSMEHGKLNYYIFVSERLKINTSSKFNFIYDQVFTLIQICTSSYSPQGQINFRKQHI